MVAVRPVSVWGKLSRRVRHEGLLHTLQLVLSRCPPQILSVHASVLFGLDLRAPVFAASEAGPEALGIRKASPGDLNLLTTTGRSEALLSERFSRGAEAWVMERDGLLIGHAWLDAGPFEVDPSLWLRGQSGDVWSMDGWVHQRFRGKGCYTQVKSAAVAAFARAGFSRCLSLVDLSNRKSIRANRAIGARVVGHLYGLRLFGFGIVLLGGQIRVGWWSGQRPLKLDVRGPRFDR